jgi:MerR family transcriptional regulator, light-induced transcriptional regulator
MNDLERTFSPKQVADALQVSESSIKRWCDRGVIQTSKTFGGHRRIPLEGFLAFLETSNREVADLSAIGLDNLGEEITAELTSGNEGPSRGGGQGRKDSLRQIFEQALIRGDEAECRRTLIDWYEQSQSLAAVADELICPVFRQVGELWHRGEVAIFQERRGCEICSRLLHEFRRLFPEPPTAAPIAIGGTVAGDHYSLNGQLIEVILRSLGWRATNLGTNLPLETIADAIEKERPSMVWLSVSHVENPERLATDFRNFWDSIPRDTVLVVGGRALDDSLRPRLNFTAHCDTMQQMSSFAKSLWNRVRT